MSLLMDALKRAESSKQEAARQQAGKEPAAGAGEGLTLAPLGDAPAINQPLPDLASHIEAVDADLARSAQGRAPAEPPPAFAQAATSSQAAARNVFIAKQTPGTGQRPLLWLVLGILIIAALAIGTYVWFQVNSLGSSSLAPASTKAPVRMAPPPVSQVAPAPEMPIQPQAVAEPAPPPVQAPEAWTPAPPAAQPAPRAPQTTAAPIRLARTQTPADANLLSGHRHLQEGNLPMANQNFLQVLQHDPNNTDALLALAAIAQHQGRSGEAEAWRQRALIADPSLPATQAAILGGTAARTDPQTTESRLKTLLAAQPQSAELNFTLGNLYAAQRRWAEAQQAYFNAVAADNDNPDYLFNLAVSLDQLRQPRPAAQHYRLALEAASRRPATFDKEAVGKRLAELQP
ncbi:MAG: tetratricopeptide repeat protein [Dechloromonas sp.]|nr:MAG: tetratricopeptide repeat protein [Dechloromonas sp.]